MSLHKGELVQMPRGSTGRLLKGEFSQRTKNSSLCPNWSAERFAYFAVFEPLLQQMGSSHMFCQKSSPNRTVKLSAAPCVAQTKSCFSRIVPDLGESHFDIQIQMVPWSSSGIYSFGGSSWPHSEHIPHQQLKVC